MSRIPECHPERKHCANGLCRPCYIKGYAPKYAKTNKYQDYQHTYRKNIGRFKKYNISKQDYKILDEAYGGRCGICKKRRKLAIDHDHACCPDKCKSCGKCIRGLLCYPCNVRLGWMETNLEAIKEHLGWAS